MRATLLLKENVQDLLRRHGYTQRDLAQYCRCTESWLSHIYADADRAIPSKYLDSIADFFGLAVYQLFLPGVSRSTERRSGLDRRKTGERRTLKKDLPEPKQHRHRPRAAVATDRQAIGHIRQEG